MPDMYDRQGDDLAWAEEFLTTKARVTKMMECPACGEDIPADSKKCPECGYSLKTASSSSGGAEGPMKGRVSRKSYECPTCGAFNMLAAKACHTCGNNFHKGGKGGGGGGGGGTGTGRGATTAMPSSRTREERTDDYLSSHSRKELLSEIDKRGIHIPGRATTPTAHLAESLARDDLDSEAKSARVSALNSTGGPSE